MQGDQVLVIDDEKEICFLLTNMLRKIGFKARSASSLLEGNRLLEKGKYKVVFLDLCLPDGIGFSLISRIKSLNADTKVVVISAYEGDWEKQRAQIEGADFFISKPFNKKMIIEALNEFTMTAII